MAPRGDRLEVVRRTADLINYRVDDLDGIIAQVREGGATDIKGPETHENGRFAWVMDPEGNKVELWEPKLWRAKT